VSERLSHGAACFFVAGVVLDLPGENSVDWNEIAAILEEAYRLVASRQLIAELKGR